jgi:flagellar hook assembly protein FlgD
VRVEVFDMLGRQAHTLVDGVEAAGTHSHFWDGRDASGRRLASGIYVIRMSAEGEVRLATMALSR